MSVCVCVVCVCVCVCVYVCVCVIYEKFNHTEQQQFEARIVQLTSDKKDLLTQLQYYEEKLKAANECENFC